MFRINSENMGLIISLMLPLLSVKQDKFNFWLMETMSSLEDRYSEYLIRLMRETINFGLFIVTIEIAIMSMETQGPTLLIIICIFH